jgi:beta-glucosidase
MQFYSHGSRTFPAKFEDIESSKNWIGTPIEKPLNVNYAEGIYVGYRYFSSFNVKPSYEFGYGLSYTVFDFSNLKLSSNKFKNQISLSVVIKNTGKTAGKEVVQLYLSAPSKSIDKPSSELKAFAKTKLLNPGESQTITLQINPKDLASFVTSRGAWIAEKGNYIINLSSTSLVSKGVLNFDLEEEMVVEKVVPSFKSDLIFSDLKR